MKKMRATPAVVVVAATVLTAGCGASAPASGGGAAPGSPLTQLGLSVVEHHNSPRRDGLYVQPALTKTAAATLHLDASFGGAVEGNVYAQPLYVANGPGGRGTFFVVTESDAVFALDEASGAAVWSRRLGSPPTSTGAGCGNISPLGITGTPYIDLRTRTLYLDAVTGSSRGIESHQVHALSIEDGSERGGWPLDVSTVTFGDVRFNPVVQNQRGALAVVGDTLYVPYGGHSGDCGSYRGWVVAVPLDNPGAATAWAPGARGGGVWAPGGLASDGGSVFAATGNTLGASSWAGGEAILRLGPGAVFSGLPRDFFAPSNWHALDSRDLDLGGSGPLLIDVPGASPSALVVALSKSGVAYLLDRNDLGGFGHGDGVSGEGLFSTRVADGEIINAAAAYTTPQGAFVVLRGSGGVGCPSGQGGDLVAVEVRRGSPPTVVTAWCVVSGGHGSPMVTTTDGRSDFVVWVAGAEGTERLRGWDAETGTVVFAGGGPADQMGHVRRFTTPIAVNGRILVGADGRLYAFRPQ